MLKLKIKLLGTPQIPLGDDPLRSFVTRKARALLIYMAVTKGPHPRNAIASFFWPVPHDSLQPSTTPA